MGIKARRIDDLRGLMFGALIVLELYLVLFFTHQDHQFCGSNLLLVLCSLAIGFLAIYPPAVVKALPTIHASPVHFRIQFGLLLVVLILYAMRLRGLFIDIPVDPQISDVIPSIQVLARRLLSGQFVYTPIEDFGYHLPVTYMPLQWLPYTVAELLRIDYRWVAYAIFAIACLVLLAQRSFRKHAWWGYLLPGFIALALHLITRYNAHIVQTTVELMVAGYYMLFIAGIGSRNIWIKTAVIVLCLMSRYTLVLWLPLWFLCEGLAGGGFRRPFIISLLAVAGVAIIYVIPFLSHDWGSFNAGYQYYTLAATGEWNHLNEHGLPYHLYNGVGVARYFYEHNTSLPVADRLHLLQRWHLAACLLSVLLMVLGYIRFRRKLSLKPFLLGSFKIYLTVFLALIQVPYVYVMITGAFVSIAIWAVLPARAVSIASAD